MSTHSYLITSWNYDGNSYENTAIFEQCTLSIAFENGSTMEGFTETYYVKDLGNGPVEARLYINDVPYFETSYQIVQASLLEEPVFSDLDATDDNYIAIDYLYEEGVLGGYSDGSFKPENTVNRAELLKILVEGQGVTPDADEYQNCFPDVTTDWYAKYVCYAKEEGWVSVMTTVFPVPPTLSIKWRL